MTPYVYGLFINQAQGMHYSLNSLRIISDARTWSHFV